MTAFDYWFHHIQTIRQPIGSYKKEMKIGWDARHDAEITSLEKLTAIKSTLTTEELKIVNKILRQYNIDEI